MRPAFTTKVVGMCLLLPALLKPAYGQSSGIDGKEASIQKVIQEYCIAVSDVATEQRMARQKEALVMLEKRVEEGILRLEQGKAELQELVKRRNELRSLARKELIDIYSGMEPEAASLQLQQLDVRLASSILRQLKPRQASSILNEMNPEFAARMAKLMTSAADSGKE
jgi:flagellar motility protein MotE (MotC chaperone)